MYYNVSLALYYCLVIAKIWREFQLQKIRIYLHGVPILLGLGLSFGGLPFYEAIAYVCHVAPPPGGQLWAVLLFVILAMASSIASRRDSILDSSGGIFDTLDRPLILQRT